MNISYICKMKNKHIMNLIACDGCCCGSSMLLTSSFHLHVLNMLMENFRNFQFSTMTVFLSISPIVTGIIWGFMTGLVTRFTENVRVIEPVFIFVMAYLAYLNAEMLHLSGIMS